MTILEETYGPTGTSRGHGEFQKKIPCLSRGRRQVALLKSERNGRTILLHSKAHITKRCLGVIIRAQDLSNYYMFQIGIDQIRPHRRVAVPLIVTKNPPQHEETAEVHPIKFNIGWQIFDPPTPLNTRLDNWFDVRVTVRGQAVSLYINNELVFQQESFLQIPTGKVGFRNVSSEEALVKNVRVILQP